MGIWLVLLWYFVWQTWRATCSLDGVFASLDDVLRYLSAEGDGVRRIMFGEAAEDIPETGDETERTEDDHQGGFCVQPGIQEIADCTAHDDAADENKGQFHGHCILLREVSRLLCGRRNFRVRFIVGFRGHSERAW